VYVRVYRNSFEHFAVVSKDAAVSTNATYVNLRSSSCCGVIPSGTLPAAAAATASTTTKTTTATTTTTTPSCCRNSGSLNNKKQQRDRDNSRSRFTVVQNNFEGTVISFDCSDEDCVEEWIDAFSNVTPPASPTQGGLSPSLSPAIPRSPVMPTLTELDEEE
jgi:hypothetical protein